MDKNSSDIRTLKASLSQSGSAYSPERLQADRQSLSSTGVNGTTPQRICDDGNQIQRSICEGVESRYLNFTQDTNEDN